MTTQPDAGSSGDTGAQPDARVALTVAEALSSVVRGLDQDEAMATVRNAASDCADVLSTASRRCLDHHHVEATTIQQAADLLATAAMHARQAATRQPASDDPRRARLRRVAAALPLLTTDPRRRRAT